MSISIGDGVRVQFKGWCFGQRIILTHSYRKLSGPDVLPVETECQGIIDDIIVGGGLDILSAYLACLPADYNTSGCSAQCVYTIRNTRVDRAFVTPGTHASPATVANDSACITLKGPIAGANRRSNKHIGPVPDAVSVAGLLDAAYVTKLTTLANKLVTPVVLAGGETYVAVVMGTNPGLGMFTLEQHTIGPQSRVQRRRTVGLGE